MIENLAIKEFNKVTIEQINGGLPTFSEKELLINQKEMYQLSELDELGRPGENNAFLGKTLFPTRNRNELTFKPTGWYETKAVIDTDENGKLIYNRAHIIAFSLIGLLNEPRNLITGTRLLNDPAMERFESRIVDYIETTNNHVRYRVKPIFRDDELLSRGIHMMAKSIEDEGISFNVYIYNVQPGIKIDYKTGKPTILDSKMIPPAI
jgi:DNA-entry nuclease